MKKKITFFHTTSATPLPMKKAFEERFPKVHLITVMDDGILPEVIENDGMPTEAVKERVIEYGRMAAAQGAKAFVCMCTTLGMVMREAQREVPIPMLTIDGPMLREAALAGERIGMLITFPPTAKVSKETLMATARDQGRDVQVDVILAEGAREALNQGNKELHDQLIVDTAVRVCKDYDVLVFAQVSMIDAARICSSQGMKVLTSVKSGIEQLKKYIEEQEREYEDC